MSAVDLALSQPWAMEPAALSNLLNIAARQNEVSPQALEAYRAASLERAERARVRDGVAVIDAVGPLFARANLLTAVSGATSYDMLRRDLQAALDDPSVNAVLFNIDSPGGAANGVGELAEAVFAARGQKPIFAYVGGMGASAAYWLASAADRVVVDATALLGSIGVQMALEDREGADAQKGVKSFRFVSSQSPMKNAHPSTEAGAGHVQSVVDGMADVFVAAVARNRGRSREAVLSGFGQGGVFVGQAAVTAGLADQLGSFESTLALAARGRSSAAKAPVAMANPTVAAAVLQVRQEAIAAVQAREPNADEVAAQITSASRQARGLRLTEVDRVAMRIAAAGDDREATAQSIIAARDAACRPASDNEDGDALAASIIAAARGEREIDVAARRIAGA